MSNFHIVTSCDAGGRYEQFLPLFCHLWRLAAPFADIHVDRPFSKSDSRLNMNVDVYHHFSSGNGIDDSLDIPRPTAAKLLRLRRATSLPDNDIVMLVDVDLLPIAFRPQSVNVSRKLVAVGGDAYQDEFHFPICYLFARGSDWRELCDFSGIDIDKLCVDGFSDEILLMERLEEIIASKRWERSDINVVPRHFQGGTTTIDRINRQEDYSYEDLMAGKYMDAHLRNADDRCVSDIMDYFKQQVYGIGGAG